MTPSNDPDIHGHNGSRLRRYATVQAFESALKARLSARVTEHRDIQDLRKYLAFDRVLARLIHVAPDAWLLKGGVALEYRLKRARVTTDIDISARVGLQQMVEMLEAAAIVKLNDYFALRLGDRSKPVDAVETYRFKATILYENGRIFEELTIDIGFADPWLGDPQALKGPALLDFAGIEPATVRAISLEQHLAEKIHAYTKRYGNRESTRVKDLVDMALMLNSSRISDDVLTETLREVFTARGTHDVPAALPPPPTSWRAVYADLAGDLPIPQTSDEAHRFVADALAAAMAGAASLTGTHPSDPGPRHEARRAVMDDLTAESAEAGYYD